MNQQLSYEFTQVMPQVAQTGVQISLCTILQRGSVGGEPITNAMGQVDLAQTDYTTILSNIPCQIAVLRPFRPDISATVRKVEEYDTINDKAIELNGYYPQILQQHLAVVDGVTYELFAVEPDSQKQVTRLAARKYTL
jgi:hypothetical protein